MDVVLLFPMTPTTSVANPLQVETAPKPALPADIEQSRANFDLATHLKKLAEEKRQAEVDAINMRRLDLSKLSVDELEALQLACGSEIAARTQQVPGDPATENQAGDAA